MIKYVSNWSDHAVPPNVMFWNIYLKHKIIIYLKPKEFLSQIILFCWIFTIFISDVDLNVVVSMFVIGFFSSLLLLLTYYNFFDFALHLDPLYNSSSAVLLPQTSFLL